MDINSRRKFIKGIALTGVASVCRPSTVKRQAVVRKLALLYNAVFVGFQEVFDKVCDKAPADYWIWDGVHPTVAGHELMAREWMKKVDKRIKF